MLQNYIKVAIRALVRQKSYSIINILGLSTGIACCLLLSLYIFDEVNFDKHHADLNQIYRINTSIKTENRTNEMRTTSPPIAPAMAEEVENIAFATRAVNPPGVSQNLIRYEDNLFYETDGYLADSTLFKVFTYNFIEGNPDKALTDANAVVLKKELATKLFGNEPALNKLISISQGGDAVEFKVTGVVEMPGKSILNANFFVSMTSSNNWATYLRSEDAMGQWAGQNFVPAYVKLKASVSQAETEKIMNEVLMKYGAEDMKEIGFHKTLTLEPLKDIYLYSSIGQSPRIKYIYVIGSIALFILLIACINFMNLATAKATKRANEVGLRKVMGAYRTSLIAQFMGEAMVIVTIAVLLSIVFVQLALPSFNQLTGKEILLDRNTLIYFSIALSALAFITSIVAGSYPAFFLSSFQPAEVLKSKNSLSQSSGWMRRSLVVFQFMISITLACGMIIIIQQLNYMQAKDLGFDANAKIVLPLRTESARNKYEPLKKELTGIANVQDVSGTDYIPGSMIWSDVSFYKQGGNMDKGILTRRNSVDHGYLEMMGIKLVAGRTFSDNTETEQNKIIVNKKALQELDIKLEEAVGNQLFFDWNGEHYSFEIIGVVEDYHHMSPKTEIFPIAFEMQPNINRLDYLMVSVASQNFNSSVEQISRLWKKLVPDTPFEYTFLDDSIRKQYEDDQRTASMMTSFTIIAMIISCLGLFGLSSFIAERRVKEIGIRKVLGASVNQIVALMSKEFTLLVLIAFAIATPLAWYLMSEWLESFAYKVTVSFTVFAWAGFASLLIALITVSFESIRAAIGNPVKALRNE